MSDLHAHISHALGIIKDGWCSDSKAHCLAVTVATLCPDITVEIGVFAGRSAFPMAIAHKVIGHGKVIGIDPYSVDAAVSGQEGDHKEWWANSSNLNGIHDQIVANIALFELSEYFTLIRAKSDDVKPPERIDLLHLDGNHSDQAVRDVARFAPHIRFGGICICDDIAWPGGGVTRAVEHLMVMGFRQLYTLDGGVVLKRFFGTGK